MIPLYTLNRRVHGKPSCKGNSEIVAQGAQFTTLVGKVVDQFAVFAVFAGEDWAELEDGCVDCDTAVAFEDCCYGAEYPVPDYHVFSFPVFSALGCLELVGDFVFPHFGGFWRVDGVGCEGSFIGIDRFDRRNLC